MAVVARGRGGPVATAGRGRAVRVVSTGTATNAPATAASSRTGNVPVAPGARHSAAVPAMMRRRSSLRRRPSRHRFHPAPA